MFVCKYVWSLYLFFLKRVRIFIFMIKMLRIFILYYHRIHCPYSHCGCYQCKDSIMFAVYFHGSFSTRMALGQMSVWTWVGGHPALNVFPWEITGCMNCPAEQRDMGWVHQIMQCHYFMNGVFKPAQTPLL